MMAARRVGYTWPGFPQRGSGRSLDWRVVIAYVVVVAAVAVLACGAWRGCADAKVRSGCADATVWSGCAVHGEDPSHAPLGAVP